MEQYISSMVWDNGIVHIKINGFRGGKSLYLQVFQCREHGCRWRIINKTEGVIINCVSLSATADYIHRFYTDGEGNTRKLFKDFFSSGE